MVAIKMMIFHADVTLHQSWNTRTTHTDVVDCWMSLGPFENLMPLNLPGEMYHVTF